MSAVSRITPFLWFDDKAGEAMHFYTSVFRNSKPGDVRRYGAAGPGKPGSVMTVSFELEGQRFYALNGGPHFKFTPAVSFFVDCETQAEIDRYWEKLAADGGATNRCGWLTDQFGVTWQIVPSLLGRLLGDADPKKAGAVMQAMMQMTKLDIAALQRAYDSAAG
jgi:predicted 3-demethylubiquinone-9 3-methyltransferase (glyoxalase superfamily)